MYVHTYVLCTVHIGTLVHRVERRLGKLKSQTLSKLFCSNAQKCTEAQKKAHKHTLVRARAHVCLCRLLYLFVSCVCVRV